MEQELAAVHQKLLTANKQAALAVLASIKRQLDSQVSYIETGTKIKGDS